MPIIQRLFPHPYLSLVLAIVWVLLVNQLKIGSLIMALILATIIPLITHTWWPNCPKIKSIPALLSYILLVLGDIFKANIEVAKVILFMPKEQIKSTWIAVPIDLRTPEAITLLAGTISMTPGTITADISGDGETLLIHALHAPDPNIIRDEIKNRYEARIEEIFV